MAKIGESSCRPFLAGDHVALEEFIRKYSDALVRFAYSYVRNSGAAEDVVAESMAIFCLKKKQFPDEPSMRAYLYKIARSKAMDYLRHHRNDVPLEDVENVLPGPSAEDLHFKRQRDILLYKALQKLPEQYRQVLQLTYLDGFSVKEVCGILKKSPKQVYNLLARAKASAKEELEKEGISHEDL